MKPNRFLRPPKLTKEQINELCGRYWDLKRKVEANRARAEELERDLDNVYLDILRADATRDLHESRPKG